MQRQDLIKILNIVEAYNRSNPTREEKLEAYRKVVSIRASLNLESHQSDPLGLNLLHWAVLSDQLPQTIIFLIKDGINVNAGTTFTKAIHLFNVTPLHLAVQTDNKLLAETLLKNGADPSIKRVIFHDLVGPISQNDYSYTTLMDESTPEFALRKGSSTFVLFEKSLTDNLLTAKSNDKREYNSCLPNCFASLFYYSNKQERKALKAYKELLDKETTMHPATWLAELQYLKNAHPAIEQGQVGVAYHASLKARNK